MSFFGITDPHLISRRSFRSRLSRNRRGNGVQSFMCVHTVTVSSGSGIGLARCISNMRKHVWNLLPLSNGSPSSQSASVSLLVSPESIFKLCPEQCDTCQAESVNSLTHNVDIPESSSCRSKYAMASWHGCSTRYRSTWWHAPVRCKNAMFRQNQST